MRIRIYLTYQEIKDACRRKRDMETSYNASVNDVKYIDLIELERLIHILSIGIVSLLLLLLIQELN